MLVSQNLQPLPHDVGGNLRKLHVDALGRVFGAQHLQPADPTNPIYVSAVQSAIALVEQERTGWLHVCTEDLPTGDMQGAGKAAMTLAAFALELDRMGDALRWLTRAMHELGEEYESIVESNMDFVIARVQDDYETTLLRESFETWRENATLCKSEIDANRLAMGLNNLFI
jgi:hypothetical protein